MEPLCVALVSDFMWPNVGGVEVHLYELGRHLVARGHRVVAVTHAYGDRRGVRYMECGIKTYYLPRKAFYNNNSFPTLFDSLPLLRHVLVREGVQLVHVHSAFSSLAMQALVHCSALGAACVFTDHSLFGFEDASAILTNKLLLMVMSEVGAVVCVSHASKENTVLRGRLDPARVYVIPNAIDCANFRPRPQARDPRFVTIVYAGRLEYRKGTDLLAAVIPEVCRRVPNSRFIVAGPGRKRVLLEQLRDKHALGERLQLLGQVPHERVRDVLVQGDIFCNTSLTEAFCMAVVEAASCGLHVVSTDVGGIPEVLPEDIVSLVPPQPEALVEAILRCIPELPQRDPWAQHRRVSAMYQWSDVASRTERVYRDVWRAHDPERSLSDKIQRLHRGGVFVGMYVTLLLMLEVFLLYLLRWWEPDECIDRAAPFTGRSE